MLRLYPLAKNPKIWVYLSVRHLAGDTYNPSRTFNQTPEESMTSIFALVFFVFDAMAEDPAPLRPPNDTLIQRTVIVTMVVPGAADNPALTAETLRACMFAAQHTENLGHTVVNSCGGAAAGTNTILPRSGDPVVLLVFAGSPVDSVALQRALPPQVTAGTSIVTVLSSPFAVKETNPLVTGDHAAFTAAVIFPGNDPGRMARIFVRCLFAGGPNGESPGGLTFDEATTCWGRVSAEDLAGEYLQIHDTRDPVLNGSKLIYPPRAAPSERDTSETARELRRYDEQRRKELRTSLPTELSSSSTRDSFFKNWGSEKVLLTSMGGALFVGSGIGILTVYGQGVDLAYQINSGEHGTVGSDTLAEAEAEYVRLGNTLPWLYGSTVVGLAAVGIGFALPVESPNNNMKATVTASPSGITVSGTF